MNNTWSHIRNNKFVQGTAIGLAALGVFSGLAFVGQKLIGGFISNSQEKKSLIEGSAASYAKRIKLAFDNDGWPGTDEVALRQVIREIPSQQSFSEVAKAYQQLQYGVLTRDISNKLYTTEYNEIMAIIQGKPVRTGESVPLDYRSWAIRLKSAFDYSYGFMPGTDTDAIKAVFAEIPSKAAFTEVRKVYEAEYASDLMEDLGSEIEFWESDIMQIIESKPAK